jgi:Na+-driven multidrug efflux pump
MEDKVAAVAIATLISNVLGAILTVSHLLRIESGPCKLNLKKIEFSWRELGTICVLGLPTAFTTALYSISDLQMQSAINAFGSSVVAGNSASAKLDGFVNSFTYPLAATAMAFVGQNLGANERERVKKTIGICLLMSVSVSLLLGNGALLISDPIIRTLLPNDPIGIEVARVRIEWVLSLYFICAADSVFSFSMRSFGYPILPMVNSIITVILFRAAWMAWIYPHLPVTGNPAVDIMNVYKCYMVSWILSFAVQTIFFIAVYRRYLKGKGKKI